MPKPLATLQQLVNPDKAKEAGAGPLLVAWAKRTVHGLDTDDRQLDALSTIDANEPFYNFLGGAEMSEWVKAEIDNRPVIIDVLGLPYGGPNNGKDNDGNYFSPMTDFMDGVIDTPAVMYTHGSMNNKDSDTHGTVKGRYYTSEGGWFKVELDKKSPRFDQLYSAHKTNNLRASTGVVPASHEVAEDGHIDRWLVGELSLVDLRDGFRPSNGYAITKAVDETLFTDYYGEPVMETGSTLKEKVAAMFDDFREKIASMFMSNDIEEIDLMGKCEKCDEVAAEQAELLRTEIATLKAEQEAKPKECLPCRNAVTWVRAMVKANKLGLDEALNLVDKYEVNADGWETFKEEVEARDTTVRSAIAKAQSAGSTVSVVVGNTGGDPQAKQDQAYLDRMRSQVPILNKGGK